MSIENNPGIASTKLFVYFDTDVFAVDPESDVEAVGIVKSTGNLLANTSELARKNGRYDGDVGKDGLIVLWFDGKNLKKNGNLFSVTLHVQEDAPNGDYSIELVPGKDRTCDENVDLVQLQGDIGTINVSGGSDTKKGDTEKTAVSGLDRLQDSIILKIGNFASVAYGSLVAIDPENHDVTPFINSNDRTLVPLRFVAESLGADVQWDDVRRQVTIELENRCVVMTIGSKSYTIDGKQYSMDTAPEIVPAWNRTMVPIRFVAEALGMAVEWDVVNRLVLITPAERPWKLEGEAEAEAVLEVFQLMMMQSFLS